MNKLGITAKLTLIFVLFAMVLVIGLSLPTYNSGRAALVAATNSELLTTALEKQAALDTWVADRQQNVSDIANQNVLRETLDALISATPGSPDAESSHTTLVRDLGDWAGKGHLFPSMEIIDATSGLVMAATDALDEGKFRDDQAYFINGLKAAFVQNPYFDLSTQRPSMTAAAPVLSEDGRVVAVLAGRLDMNEMSAIIQRRSGLHQTDDAFLVNTSNLFVTQPHLNPDPAVLQLGIHTIAVNDCLAHNSGLVAAPDYRAVLAFIVYRWLPERQLCLIVKMDQAEALAPVMVLRNNILYLSIAALFAAIILAWLLARSFTLPIHKLGKGAKEIGEGNLAHRITLKSKDEIGQLAGDFNHMADSIQNMQTQLGQRAEQLESANKELEAFSYSISHDLRAPLRAMDGFSRILVDEYGASLPGEAQRYLGLVRSNAQQMGHLIEDLLTFSRLSRQPLNKQNVDTRELVNQVLADLRAEQDGRSVSISVGKLPACEADPTLLKQVWINLLSNAFKYTRKQENPQIEIGSTQTGTERIYFVKDNGVGFDMQYVNKLFGVFQRLHRAEDYEGTGVGLAIVQRIVHRQGGAPGEAEVNKGATFFFTLGGSI